MGGIIT